MKLKAYKIRGFLSGLIFCFSLFLFQYLKGQEVVLNKTFLDSVFYLADKGDKHQRNWVRRNDQGEMIEESFNINCK